MTAKGTWQGDERFLQFILTGNIYDRQYNQSVSGPSAKNAKELSLGDVKNDTFLGECKVNDTMPTKKRKKKIERIVKGKKKLVANRTPGDKYRINFKWWDEICQETEEIGGNRVPLLYFRKKFDKHKNAIVILDNAWARDWLADYKYGAVGICVDEKYRTINGEKRLCKQISTTLARDNKLFQHIILIYDTYILRILSLPSFIEKFSSKIRFNSWEEAMTAWENRNANT